MTEDAHKEYYAVYKCPICNAICPYGQAYAMTDEVIELIMHKAIAGLQLVGHPSLQQIPMHMMHSCRDGSKGLAVFAGFEVKKEHNK